MSNLDQLRAKLTASELKVIGTSSFNPSDALKSALLDPSKEVDHPPAVIKIGGVPCMTAGSFSVVIGRAKARKGFFVGAIAAAAAIGSCSIDGIRGEFNNGKTGVIYFDTEQGSYWSHIAYKRIIRAIGTERPANLSYYDLQQYTPAERVQMITAAIEGNDKLSLVVIDGVRDLIQSINDESEATGITSKILKWVSQKHVHIICLLHQNKNDFNARGHIGTELINKAESTLSVTKEKDETISTVKQDYCRGENFAPFSFMVDPESGLPVLTELSERPTTNKSEKRNTVFTHVLAGKGKVKHSWLQSQYMEATGLSKRSAIDHITGACIDGILGKDESGNYYLVSMNFNNGSYEHVPF
jgi:hypothetical protein